MFVTAALGYIILILNSDGMPSDTIFAFLMLNTPRSAHNKIFGAKFLSFERAGINGFKHSGLGDW